MQFSFSSNSYRLLENCNEFAHHLILQKSLAGFQLGISNYQQGVLIAFILYKITDIPEMKQKKISIKIICREFIISNKMTARCGYTAKTAGLFTHFL